jgi:hypothetical protein
VFLSFYAQQAANPVTVSGVDQITMLSSSRTIGDMTWSDSIVELATGTARPSDGTLTGGSWTIDNSTIIIHEIEVQHETNTLSHRTGFVSAFC